MSSLRCFRTSLLRREKSEFLSSMESTKPQGYYRPYCWVHFFASFLVSFFCVGLIITNGGHGASSWPFMQSVNIFFLMVSSL